MIGVENVQLQQVQAFWLKAIQDGFGKTAAFYEELAKVDAARNEQASGAIDEMAKLTKESIAYSASLGAEWRRLTLEAIKRSTEMFTMGTPAAK
jgi:hypothetical protein